MTQFHSSSPSPRPLSELVTLFHAALDLTPVIAFEVEYYLPEISEEKNHAFQALVLQQCETHKIRLHKIDVETGQDQYEIATFHQPDALKAVADLEALKNLMVMVANGLSQPIDFSAKPFTNQPGNGLHVHVSLFDKNGHNVLARKKGEREETSAMRYAVGGLCDTMLNYMHVFAPNPASYRRFSSCLNPDVPAEEPMRAHNNAPVNVSWGGNNRTTAIRIPTSTLYPEYRHIEHRVAGADADPERVTAAILEGIYIGITEQREPPEKVWGNAYDAQYNLLPFPKVH